LTVSRDDVEGDIMVGFPPPRGQRVTADRVYSTPAITRWFMQHVREVERTADVSSGRVSVATLPVAAMPLGDVVLRDADGAALTFDQMLERTSTDGILVLRRGHVVAEHYRGTLGPTTPHLYHSITKSLGSCVAANLTEEGLLDPEEPVTTYVPELAGSAYANARVRHLLDMTVAIRYTEDHENDDTEDGRLDRLCGVKPSRAPHEPGSAYEFAMTTARDGEHGETFHYVSLNTTVLGWVMERATGVAVPRLLSDKLWSRLATEDDAYVALDGAGSAQLDGGFCSSLRDLARFGQMLLQDGSFGGGQVVPAWLVEQVRKGGDKAVFAASPDSAMLPSGGSYRDCFWVCERADHTTFMGLGMYGQMLYVNQMAGLVVAKFSSQLRPADDVLGAHTFRALETLAEVLA
jgi:CubicO group peptidase (beta-lactamase class C family)